jgi:hypothetical protein
MLTGGANSFLVLGPGRKEKVMPDPRTEHHQYLDKR